MRILTDEKKGLNHLTFAVAFKILIYENEIVSVGKMILGRVL